MAKNRTAKNGSVVSDKMSQNFIEGANITLTVTDDGDSANVQIDASGLVTTKNGGLEAVNAIGSSGASKTLGLTGGNIQTVSNSASCTYTMPSGLTSGVGIAFTLIVTNGGAFTATFTGVKWAAGAAPTLTSGSGKVDIFTFLSIDGGTTWYGFVGGQAMA